MQIVPQRLRRLRIDRGLSRQQLATMSKVSPKQIQRLEDPKQASRNVRPSTLNRLADALDVGREQLTGEPPSSDDAPSIRIGAALLPGVRLAYELVERRYGVTVGQLLNMAPLFFAFLAEGSLAWRRAELSELQTAIDRVVELSDSGRKRFALSAWHAGEDSAEEGDAIERGDLFSDPFPPDYRFEPDEDWDGNPFADYLRRLAEDIGRPELIELDAYDHGRAMAPAGMPGYRIYGGDLEAIAPLDSDAMYALHVGDAALSDIPDEFMVQDAADARQAWLDRKLSAKSAAWLETLRKFSLDWPEPVDREGEDK